MTRKPLLITLMALLLLQISCSGVRRTYGAARLLNPQPVAAVQPSQGQNIRISNLLPQSDNQGGPQPGNPPAPQGNNGPTPQPGAQPFGAQPPAPQPGNPPDLQSGNQMESQGSNWPTPVPGSQPPVPQPGNWPTPSGNWPTPEPGGQPGPQPGNQPGPRPGDQSGPQPGNPPDPGSGDEVHSRPGKWQNYFWPGNWRYLLPDGWQSYIWPDEQSDEAQSDTQAVDESALPGLGATRANWEEMYGSGKKDDYGYYHYNDEHYIVKYIDDRVSSIEISWDDDDAPTLAKARSEIEDLIPADSDLIENYTRGRRIIDHFSSEIVAPLFADDAWVDADAGEFVVVYHTYDQTMINTAIITLGNNP